MGRKEKRIEAIRILNEKQRINFERVKQKRIENIENAERELRKKVK